MQMATRPSPAGTAGRPKAGGSSAGSSSVVPNVRTAWPPPSKVARARTRAGIGSSTAGKGTIAQKPLR